MKIKIKLQRYPVKHGTYIITKKKKKLKYIEKWTLEIHSTESQLCII